MTVRIYLSIERNRYWMAYKDYNSTSIKFINVPVNVSSSYTSHSKNCLARQNSNEIHLYEEFNVKSFFYTHCRCRYYCLLCVNALKTNHLHITAYLIYYAIFFLSGVSLSGVAILIASSIFAILFKNIFLRSSLSEFFYIINCK